MGELLPLVMMPPQSAAWLTSVPLPSKPGVKATLALALPAVAVPMVGAEGGKGGVEVGVTEFDSADQGLTPTLLVVLTLQL